MRVYIQTDIEGVAGYCSFEDRKTQTLENHEHRMRMYRLLTGEVNAAVRAARSAGADIIYVNDNHGTGYNIFFEELEEDCEVIHGRATGLPTWLPSLDRSFDALVLVGMHAMGGEVNGVCPHSKWEVNGGEIYLSEASMAMALAGDLSIPTVFVSGDQVITGELQQKNPAIQVATVKHAYGPFSCRSILPRKAQEMIFAQAKEGIDRRKEIPPYELKSPLTLNLLDSEGHIPPLKPVLKEPVLGETITEAFHKAMNQFPWGKFAEKIVDHYRYPTNLTGKKRN